MEIRNLGARILGAIRQGVRTFGNRLSQLNQRVTRAADRARASSTERVENRQHSFSLRRVGTRIANVFRSSTGKTDAKTEEKVKASLCKALIFCLKELWTKVRNNEGPEVDFTVEDLEHRADAYLSLSYMVADASLSARYLKVSKEASERAANLKNLELIRGGMRSWKDSLVSLRSRQTVAQDLERCESASEIYEDIKDLPTTSNCEGECAEPEMARCCLQEVCERLRCLCLDARKGLRSLAQVIRQDFVKVGDRFKMPAGNRSSNVNRAESILRSRGVSEDELEEGISEEMVRGLETPFRIEPVYVTCVHNNEDRIHPLQQLGENYESVTLSNLSQVFKGQNWEALLRELVLLEGETSTDDIEPEYDLPANKAGYVVPRLGTSNYDYPTFFEEVDVSYAVPRCTKFLHELMLKYHAYENVIVEGAEERGRRVMGHLVEDIFVKGQDEDIPYKTIRVFDVVLPPPLPPRPPSLKRFRNK